MASKHQASSSKQPDSREMKLKEEDKDDTLATLEAAPKKKYSTTTEVLSAVLNAQVYGDYDCTLNQTDIGTKNKDKNKNKNQNKDEDEEEDEDKNKNKKKNNKFYIMQLLEQGDTYHVWSRWGRVGEAGEAMLMACGSQEDAKKEFEKKFREKTKNKWTERVDFVSHPGNYTLIEVQPVSRQEMEAAIRVKAANAKLPCTLDKHGKNSKFVVSRDVFQDAMQTMNIDVKKMPLGQLSQQQIAKGFEALEELKAELEGQSPEATRLEELSSHFYTIVPHNFGWARPPPINSPELLRAKDLLSELEGLSLQEAQSLQE